MSTVVAAKPKYAWWKGVERWDLVLMGQPDCFAYMVRYHSHRSAVPQAWCWHLFMPRGGREVARGYASAAHLAKRQIEAAIQENWA